MTKRPVRGVFGGGWHWLSRKKRSSPAKAVSVTPKTLCSEDDEEESALLASTGTQSSQEHSTSGFTPVAKKRRNTFGSRKAPQIYHSVSDDLFFSPSILCRKSTIRVEGNATRRKDQSKDSSPSNESSSSSHSESQLSRQFDCEGQQKSQEMADSTLFSVSANESLNSGKSSIIGITQGKLQNTKNISQDKEFDFDDSTTIHSAVNRTEMKQPSSTMTSLDEARAYFAQLDASPIVMEAVDDRERHRNVVRTRRRLLPTHPTVRKEYREYVQACECAKVPAMPLEEFARHRKLFQANDVIYEGFLDVED